MINIAQNSVAKLSVAFVTVAMLFTLVAPAAKAQTTSEDLAAQIANLMAQIAMLEAQLGGTTVGTTTCVAIPAPLTIGAQNANVTALQNFLISAGEVIPAGATGYFGSQTQAALASWQAANGVAPAVGYYGPITKAAIDASCVVVDNGDDMDDEDEDEDDDMDGGKTLGNDEGSIDNVDEVSADESSLEEGEMGGVLAFEVEIEGDLQIDRMDFFAEIDDNTVASDDADDYFETASLWMDGDMIAEIDVDEFDDDDYTGNVNASTNSDEFRLRFSGLDLIFEDGDMPEFQLGFEMASTIDSDDLDGTWKVELESIRYIDGVGFSGSETYTNIEETFGVDEEEMAEIRMVESSDSPKATTFQVDADDETEGVKFYAFEVEEENGVDVTIDEIEVDFDSSDSDLGSVITEARLMVDGDELDSQNVPTNGIVTFEDLDFMLEADEEVEMWVEVDFNDLTGNYVEGTTVFVTNVEITEIEDENGFDESDYTASDLEITADGETHTLRTEGIMIGEASFTESIKDTNGDTAGGEQGVYTIEFDVTAFDDVMYIPTGATTATSSVTANKGVIYVIEDEDGNEVATTSNAVVSSSAERSGNYFRVDEGENNSESFTLTVTVTPQTDGFYRIALYGVNYNVTTAAAADSMELATPEEDYETDYEDIDA